MDKREKNLVEGRHRSNYSATFVERAMRHEAHWLVSRSRREREQLLVDLANMPGESGTNWFSRKWGARLWPETPCALTEVSDDLRRIWRLSNAEYVNFNTWRVEGEGAKSGHPPDVLASKILNKWLSWRPSAAQMRAYMSAQSQKEQRDRGETSCGIPLQDVCRAR